MDRTQLELVMCAAKSGYQVTIDEGGRLIIGTAPPALPTPPTPAPAGPDTQDRAVLVAGALRVRWQNEEYGFSLRNEDGKVMWSFVKYPVNSQGQVRYRVAPGAPAARSGMSGRKEKHVLQCNRSDLKQAKANTLAFIRAANPDRRVVVVS